MVGFHERAAQENQGNLVCLLIPGVGCFLGESGAPPDVRGKNVASTCGRERQSHTGAGGTFTATFGKYRPSRIDITLNI